MKNGGKEEERQLIYEVRKGIGDALRSKIWPLLIQKPVRPFEECRNKCQLKDIELDLERTFPNHKDSKNIEEKMKTVLNALAYSMPEVGYCQGTQLVRKA